LDVFHSPVFSFDAERREGLALGVEFDPVCGPLPDHSGYAALDHQVGAGARYLQVQSFGVDLQYLDARI
jgi:hypothetical protein